MLYQLSLQVEKANQPTIVLQIDKDEVRLRRTIGPKKDEFTVDRKHVK